MSSERRRDQRPAAVRANRGRNQRNAPISAGDRGHRRASGRSSLDPPTTGQYSPGSPCRTTGPSAALRSPRRRCTVLAGNLPVEAQQRRQRSPPLGLVLETATSSPEWCNAMKPLPHRERRLGAADPRFQVEMACARRWSTPTNNADNNGSATPPTHTELAWCRDMACWPRRLVRFSTPAPTTWATPLRTLDLQLQ